MNATLHLDIASSDPRASDLRWRPQWFVGVGAGIGGCLVFLAVPYDSIASSVLYLAISMAALAVVTVAAVRMPAEVRGIWWAVWGYVLLNFVADAIFTSQVSADGQASRPGITDVLYLAAYACALAGLVLLVRRVHQGHDTKAWIDTLIIVVALASYTALLVVEPTIRQATESGEGAAMAVGLTYVLFDLLILSGLVRLVVGDRDGGGSHVNGAIVILAAAILATFSADLALSSLQANGVDADANVWTDTLFLAAFVGIAAAARAPGAKRIPVAVDPTSEPISSARMIGLAVGALAVPVLIVVTVWNDSGREYKLLTVACLLAILLVLWRFRLMLGVAQRQALTLSSLARTDSLTGLPNRRTLDFELERIELAGADSPLTVAMLDLDLFKAYNDIHGHRAGDLVLAACARAWQAAVPSPAVIARYGGEEFVVLLPGVELMAAEPLVERLRAATPGTQTVSIGVAERRAGESGFEAMRRADRGLYLAKQAGRDRIVLDRPSQADSP